MHIWTEMNMNIDRHFLPKNEYGTIIKEQFGAQVC